MKKILKSLLTIAVVASLAVGASQAFFSDTETSSGNTFTAGAIDLKIDNSSWYNGVYQNDTSWELSDLTDQLFFDFADLKPGDWGEDTLSLHVNNNDVWACLNISLTANDDNGCSEPELGDDPSCDNVPDDEFDGELAQNLNFIFWVDDGDNVLEEDEYDNGNGIMAAGSASEIFDGVTWSLADSQENNVGGNPGDPLVGLVTYYIGKAWCFGALTPAPVPPGGNNTPSVNPGVVCDGTLVNNAAQTDLLRGDIAFSAVQHRNNPDFVCEGCSQAVYAHSVEAVDQGLKKNGNPVNANRSDPNDVLGAPDGSGNPVFGFFSLGFGVGFGGTITIAFEFPVEDGAGVDLSFHEITNDRDFYPLEKAKVEVSSDGSTWYEIGEATSEPGGDGVTYLDISDNPSAPSTIRYVRLTDTTDPNIHPGVADGYDLDAIDAIYGACER